MRSIALFGRLDEREGNINFLAGLFLDQCFQASLKNLYHYLLKKKKVTALTATFLLTKSTVRYPHTVGSKSETTSARVIHKSMQENVKLED